MTGTILPPPGELEDSGFPLPELIAAEPPQTWAAIVETAKETWRPRGAETEDEL